MLLINMTARKFGINIVSFAGIAVLIINALSYLLWNGFVDHGEVCMSSVAWLFYNGFPIYTELNATDRYSLEHGPIIYILIGGLMKSLGAGIFSAKLSGVLAILGIIALSWHWFKKLVDTQTSFWLLGLESLILLRWYDFYFNRPDSLMVLCVLASMYFATIVKKRVTVIIGTAIFLGILGNLKLDGFFSAIPILFLIYQRFGWKDFLNTSVVMVCVWLLPFMLPNISLNNYIQWLSVATKHGFSLKTFLRTTGVLCLYFLGIISLGLYQGKDLLKIYKQNMIFIGGIVFSAIVLAVISSKHGSGSNHLAPLIPVMIYLLIITITASTKVDNKGTNWHKTSYALLIIVCFLLILNAINGQKRIIQEKVSLAISVEMFHDFNSLKEKYKGHTMMVGYGGSNKAYCIYRQLVPLMVFDGNPYLFDACALMDMQYSDLKIPDSTIKEIEAGRVKIWLIPKGESPFTLTNYYNHKLLLFDENFRNAFSANYKLAEQTKYFDLWFYNGSR